MSKGTGFKLEMCNSIVSIPFQQFRSHNPYLQCEIEYLSLDRDIQQFLGITDQEEKND